MSAPRDFPVTVRAADLETVLDAFTPRTQMEDDSAALLRKAMGEAESQGGHEDAPLQGN